MKFLKKARFTSSRTTSLSMGPSQEERYTELLEAEDEVYNAHIRASLEDIKAGRVKQT